MLVLAALPAAFGIFSWRRWTQLREEVAERTRAEEALRESEGRFRRLAEAGSEGILIASEDRIVEANRRLSEMFGYQPSELIGMTPRDIFTPESAELILKRIESGDETPYEITGVRKGGSTFPVEAVGKDCRYDGGAARVAALRDITERKRMEEALRESEARFRSTLDSMIEGCQIIGFDWRYLFVNDAVARHGRRAKEELLGHTMMEIYPGIDDTEMFAYLRRCMEERIPHRMENEFTYPDGAKAWFELSIQPVPEGIFILSLDITERRRAEEALRESQEKYRDLVENINDVIFEVDTTGRVTYISPAVEALGGYSPSEIIGRYFTEFLHPDELPGLAESFQRGLSGDPQPSEYRLLAKSGETLWARSFSRPISEGDRIVALRGVLTDITERKAMEEALQKAREELEARVEHQMLRRNPYGLTFRELTLLHLVAAGESDRQIGLTLGISPLTAQKHISNILAKMEASCRTEASVRAVREGLLD